MIDEGIKKIYVNLLKRGGKINSVEMIDKDCYLVTMDIPMPGLDRPGFKLEYKVVLVPSGKKVSEHLKYHLSRPSFDTSRIII